MKKPVLIVLIAVCVLVMLAANAIIAWVIYSTFFADKNSPQQTTSQVESAAPTLERIQKAVQQDKAWAAFNVSPDANPEKSSATVYVDLADSGVADSVGIVPDGVLTISPVDGGTYDEASIASLQALTTTALKNEGLSIVSLAAASNTIASYDGTDLSCSLSVTEGAAYAALACATEKQITDTSTAVKSLAAVETPRTDATSYAIYKQADGTNGNTAVATLTTFTDQEAGIHSYIYTESKEKGWVFVGDAIPQKGATTIGGKMAATPEIEALIADPTYGPLYLSLVTQAQ